jgi:predicted anti-sigma-YlaC factor YlaD
VNCERCREALSARLDGESATDLDGSVDHHLAGCASCREWRARAVALHRAVRVAPADTVPDLTAAILAAAPRPTRREAVPGWARVGLVGVAVAQLGVALSALLFGATVAGSLHVAHELASWEIALSFGFLFAAGRPARAWGMLPLVAAVAACLVATTAIDMTDGRAAGIGEASHALEVTGLFFLFAMTRRNRRNGVLSPA